MPSLRRFSTIRCRGQHIASPATSIVRFTLCLAFVGCSAEDDIIPPQPQAPSIVAQPSIVVSGIGARITATINPNGIDTECYFEYGPTTTYGRRLPDKFIQAKLNDVVVSDTIAGLGLDTTYHCRLVATNAQGTVQSSDREFAVANLSPTIVVGISFSVSKDSVAVTATVNPNYRPTDCHYEYGQTAAYGMRTASKSIGAGGSGVVVRDTITGLAPDTAYHCRLIAENSAGRIVGSDQIVVVPSGRPFITSDPSVAYNGLGVAVSAKVNPNGLTTSCYFEFGLTTAYGTRLVTRSIGAGYADVVVSDTITGVPPRTPMHCRLVAANANGKRESADRTFSMEEFVYPLTVGTRWFYRYYYYGYDWYRAHHRGTQVWEIVERISADSVRIQVDRIDSVIYSWSDPPTVTRSQVSFGVSRTRDLYAVGWKDLTYRPSVVPANYVMIPRYTEAGSDTVRFWYSNYYSECDCRYVNGKGLVSYYYIHVPNSYVTETLTLDSLIVAP